jgi:DNA-binding PadR family transcriptional regulator
MSLRHALINLLAGEPMSGYDLARSFSVSMANTWPAQHSQIYPELAKLVGDGLITQTGQGPRGRKVYETTPAGLDALRSWLRNTPPDYSVRFEALLRVFCLWALPTEEALAHLARDREEYARHLAQMETAVATGDWGHSPASRAGRLTIDFGLRFYAALIEWIDWASEQIRAGTLQPGGPLPARVTDSRPPVASADGSAGGDSTTPRPASSRQAPATDHARPRGGVPDRGAGPVHDSATTVKP